LKNSSSIKPAQPEQGHRRPSEPTAHPRLRPQDVEALSRLLANGPLTIPQAYDCGHSDNETTGHGMNRLVAASLATFSGWNQEDEDAMWMITARGKGAIVHELGSR